MGSAHIAKRAVAPIAVGALIAGLVVQASARSPTSGAGATKAVTVRLKINGGHRTDPRDGGRPVVLIAAALGVPTKVFRTAFSGVEPAAGGEQPDPEQVRQNKEALLRVLAPYGVTNEKLDTVSNYYRFNGSAGETWPQRRARGRATIRGGKVTSARITIAGAGYSSTPSVRVPGHPSVRVKVKLAYGKNLATNGRVRSLSLATR